MIWIGLLIVLIAASLILAFYSMRSYQEIPVALGSYSLFLVRNSPALNTQLLDKMHQLAAQAKVSFSLERLFKGEETALVIFGPASLVRQLPELDPLELEDYLQSGSSLPPSLPGTRPPKVSVNDSFTLTIAPRNNPKKSLLVRSDFLKMLSFEPEQHFFWQIVASPLPKRSKSDPHSLFQVTIRAMIVDRDAVKKIGLAKRIDQEIRRGTGLSPQPRKQTSQSYFSSFAQRTIIPKEVAEFSLNSAEIVSLTA